MTFTILEVLHLKMTGCARRRLEARELLGREAGARGDEGLAVLDGQVERAQALLHAGHVDERVALVDDGCKVVCHGDAQVAPEACPPGRGRRPM